MPIEYVYMLYIVWNMDCIQQGWFFRNPLLYQTHLGAANSHYELCKFAFFSIRVAFKWGSLRLLFWVFSIFGQMYLGAAYSYCELCKFAFFFNPLRLQMRVSLAIVLDLFFLTKCVWAPRILVANFVSVPFPPVRFAFKWGSLCRLFLVCFLWPNPFGRRKFLLRILWIFFFFMFHPLCPLLWVPNFTLCDIFLLIRCIWAPQIPISFFIHTHKHIFHRARLKAHCVSLLWTFRDWDLQATSPGMW